MEWVDGSQGIIIDKPEWNDECNSWCYLVRLHTNGFVFLLEEGGLQIDPGPEEPIKQ